MAKSKARVIAISAIILIACLLIFFALRFLASDSGSPSNIVDFRPSSFPAKANASFFYSIGKELKYSDTIDSQAHTLVRGEIKNFLVSPNDHEIAVVADGHLIIADAKDQSARTVAAVGSIYRDPKPIGQPFFRDDNFQWSEDSKSLYLIKDEYYESKGSQLYSTKGELWKYEVSTGNLTLVLKPFEAYTYFFGKGSGIYFSAPAATGDLHLQYFDGKKVRDITSQNVSGIPLIDGQAKSLDSPFFSFSLFDYRDTELARKGVQLPANYQSRQERLVIGDKTALVMSQGESFKGPYFCSELLRSVFLPGGRYFLFNASYCGNYDGQLLIDSRSGQYSTLPKDTRVYITLNTRTHPEYDITGDRIVAR